jgi:hypothetical protein
VAKRRTGNKYVYNLWPREEQATDIQPVAKQGKATVLILGQEKVGQQL